MGVQDAGNGGPQGMQVPEGCRSPRDARCWGAGDAEGCRSLMDMGSADGGGVAPGGCKVLGDGGSRDRGGGRGGEMLGMGCQGAGR